MRAARSLYDVLNVSHDAEPVVIEAAYRALMKKYHPDQGGEPPVDAPSAADINRAFSILRDAEKRTQYDHYEWSRQQQMTLAQYLPPPQAPRAFGWGGWIVALLLAGIIVLMARGKDDAASVPQADLATPARADTRPAAPAPRFLQSDAPERDVRRLQRIVSLSSRAVEAETQVAGQARVAPPKRQKARAHHRPGKRSRRDKEFLEREGYIY